LRVGVVAVVKVHLKGHFCIASTLVKRWRDQVKAGIKVDARIVNTSSGAGLQGSVGQSNYAAAKGGIASLTLVQAAELGRYGITVNAVCPGLIDTELTRENASLERLEEYAKGYPVPRLGTAREVADLVCFAASEAAGYITGASFDINGGDLMM